MFYSPTRPGTASTAQFATSRVNTNSKQSINNNRADRGATNEAILINYHIRFFSSKPIHQAIVRAIELQQEKPNEQYSEILRTLIDRDFSQYIVVTVTFDSMNGRFFVVDGKPFLDADSGFVRFSCELNSNIKLNTKYKLSDIMFDGKLEF